ncbi:MAG: hypothetical protein WDM78_21475 [Puia sp.]
MSPLQGREPGMVGAIYDDANVMSSIICDGVHVDYASVRISKKVMGERLFFIQTPSHPFPKVTINMSIREIVIHCRMEHCRDPA